MLRYIYPQPHHSEEDFHYMARVLYLWFRDRIKADPRLEVISLPRYVGGIGDVGLERVDRDHSDYAPLIIVEIGTVGSSKPLEGLMGSVKELWVPIFRRPSSYIKEERLPKKGIYVFKRGPNWHLWMEYKFMENQEFIEAVLRAEGVLLQREMVSGHFLRADQSLAHEDQIGQESCYKHLN